MFALKYISERLQGGSRPTRAASSGKHLLLRLFSQLKVYTFWNSVPDYFKSVANDNTFKKSYEILVDSATNL